ncbi:hypothetical protein Cni_G14492 [Canna indica]|uniref:Uncharacterized protein n=1 Tax=Canna indica TaxID=4628 RepID=A0AAQ3QDR0_9LILI|nr:hypothetical protein Cni_G14492 [Canna indica]
MRDLDEEDNGEEFVLVSNHRSSSNINKENLAPPWVPKSQGGERETSRSNSDEPGYRQPDLDSATLFDPELLAAFEEAVKHMRSLEEAKSKARSRDVVVEEDEDGQPNRAEERPTKLPRTDEA